MAYDPVIAPNGIVQALEAHRGRVDQTRENSARYAQSFATYTTTGDGQFLIEDAHMFGCKFTQQPIIAYGYSLDDEQLVSDRLPRCNGGVRSWIRDKAGLYTGAYVFLLVDTTPLVRTTLSPVEEAEASATPKTFVDLFDRPDNALIGNGWVQTGGDFYINTSRVLIHEATAWMGQPFGRVNLSCQAHLRTPDTTQPAVWAWGNSSEGGPSGYVFAFSGSAGGVNMTLRAKDVQVHGIHFGPAGVPIGNAQMTMKMEVIEANDVVTVKCWANGALQFTYQQPSADAPTGMYSGVGNQGPAGNQHIDDYSMAQITDTQTEPPDPEAVDPVEYAPVYVIEHDFTFTAIAMKDLPAHLLDL